MVTPPPAVGGGVRGCVGIIPCLGICIGGGVCGVREGARGWLSTSMGWLRPSDERALGPGGTGVPWGGITGWLAGGSAGRGGCEATGVKVDSGITGWIGDDTGGWLGG